MTFSEVIRDSPITKGTCVDYLMHLKGHIDSASVAWVWYGASFTSSMQNSLLSNGSGALAAIPDSLFQAVKPHLKVNQWVEFTFNLSDKAYSCRALTVNMGDERSAVLIFSEQAPVMSPHQTCLAELCLSNISFLRQQQDTDLKLKELGRHMLYQIVWSEILEWIRTLDIEDDDFYKKLMVRLMLLTESSASAIYIENEKENLKDPSQWFYRGINFEDIEQFEQILNDKNKQLHAAMVMEDFNDLSNTYSGYSMVAQHAHLLLCPVIDPEGQRKAIIILSKKPTQDGFLITDHIYINQLINQVYSGIEKNRLVSALERSNQSLEKEHEAQKQLIQQLQDTQAQLLQSEKMASIGQLAAGVAHEINNPIGFVNSNLSTLSEFSQSMLSAIQALGEKINGGNDVELQQFYTRLAKEHEIEFITDDLSSLLEESKEGISRVRGIVQDLKDFSHTDSGEFSIVDLRQTIDKTLNLIHNEIKYSVELITDYAELPEVEMMESQISQVILNLLVNASHAIEDRGTITIKTMVDKHQDSIQIMIQDTGKGISPEHLGKLFDPFFTTKPVGKGTGLGLSLSYGIIQRHHGDISVESELGVGTTFKVTLPVTQPVVMESEASKWS
ncbi:ATP-binding protein [Alkalimarinus alittae]|uniref:histidine kinase n=1 Tax=Alkalimarinus alittae TaxID=2961619 RepID=A0ABY6N5Z9_9ALTE|nr:ATP-binding protein [Alkalimarinus alittae]UZE97402.1 ATP-binding protein [Alkalimarinus alittae]